MKLNTKTLNSVNRAFACADFKEAANSQEAKRQLIREVLEKWFSINGAKAGAAGRRTDGGGSRDAGGRFEKVNP